jgi:hypothetical protein
MKTVLAMLMLMTLPSEPPVPENWCEVGQQVIIPDGREGPVLSVTGDICKVLVYGEKYVSLWAYFLIEPAHPTYGR